MSQSNWPAIPKPLIDKLLAAFPLKPYNPKISPEENLINSGKAEVVLFLHKEYQRQEDSGPIPPLR